MQKRPLQAVLLPRSYLQTLAAGDILSVFDADDLMHPQRIELISTLAASVFFHKFTSTRTAG